VEDADMKTFRSYQPDPLLLHGYSTGTYSSRRMAAKLADDVAYWYLAAGNVPGFRTLSDFRKTHGPALNGLFVQVLKLWAEAGLVKCRGRRSSYGMIAILRVRSAPGACMLTK
jgi:transposase